MFLRTLAVVLAVLGLAACGQEPPGPPATPPGDASADPLDLVGLWELDGVDEEPGTILRLAGDELSLWRACGPVWGDWRASSDGLFVASTHGWSGGCGEEGDPRPAWLAAVTGFDVGPDGPVLLDREGGVVAALAPGDPPEPPDTVAPHLADPPDVTDEVRARLTPARPVPEGLDPADPAALVGRWVPAEDIPAPAVVGFGEDGTWEGSDGCNEVGGRWVGGADGALLATVGPSTGIGCDGAPVGGWLSQVRRAGLDGATLVLLDGDGAELGRLVPAP